jgi:hypothetical protein
MSKRHYLTFYTLTLRKNRSEQLLAFDESQAAGKKRSFIRLLEDYVGAHKTERFDDSDKTTIWVSDANFGKKSDEFHCLFHKGNSGPEGTLFNNISKTRKGITENDAPVYPYYLYVWAPGNGTHGLIAFHNRGNEGCKTAFEKSLNRYLSEKETDFRAEIKTLAFNLKSTKSPPRVRRIEITQFVPLSVTNRVYTGSAKPKEVKATYRVWLPEDVGNIFELDDLLKTEKKIDLIESSIKNMITLPKSAANKTYSVTVDLDGVQRTMKLHKGLEISFGVEITHHLNGKINPSVAELHKAASDSIQVTKAKLMGR